MSAPLFACRDLVVLLETGRALRRALDRVSMELRPGEPFGLLGESGSGKTLLFHSVFGLSDAAPGIVAGSAELLGQALFPEIDRAVAWEPGPPETVRKDMTAWNRRLRRRVAPVLGRDVGLVPQDPGTAFPPYLTVGDLLARAVRRRDPGLTREEARRQGIEQLARVGMYRPEEVATQHPYQLSGGMVQRVALALALAPRPALLVADEPTTGLDATLRLRVLQLLARAPAETGTTLLLVTHDTEAARLLCWRVAVLCGGRVVEEGPVGRVLNPRWSPKHPYTEMLLAAEAALAGGGRPPATRAGGAGEGCPFSGRCSREQARCASESPPQVALESGHRLACWEVGA
ncbi:oligopeptide/dipeptide ABC transporter ATP-binding protein [Deferrisoma palaeochoriense]